MSNETRQAIINSLFPDSVNPPPGSAAANIERLVVYLKVFEDVRNPSQDDGQEPGDSFNDRKKKAASIMGKPRYLCLTARNNGKVRLHKAKKNSNGSFAIGKTWTLDDVKQIDVIDPNTFVMTLGRPCEWAVERPKEKMVFIANILDLCQSAGKKTPVVTGVDMSQVMKYLNSPSSASNSPAISQAQVQAPPPRGSPSLEHERSGGSSTPKDSRSSPTPHRAALSSREREDRERPPPPRDPQASRATPERGDSARQNRESPPTRTAPPRDDSSKEPLSLEPEKNRLAPPMPPVPLSPRSDSMDKEEGEGRKGGKGGKALGWKVLRKTMLGGSKEAREVRKKIEEDLAKERAKEQASLINVDELLSDFDWKSSGNAAALEKRLVGELTALEAANVHAIIQADDRVVSVIAQIDRALHELDLTEHWLGIYTAELDSMGDEIHYIESQNRGLQVQTANQRALISELENVLRGIALPPQVVTTLKQEPFDSIQSIKRLEEAAVHLQRVLHFKREEGIDDMKVVKERTEVNLQEGNNFSNRVYEYLRVIWAFQADATATDVKSRPPPSASTRGSGKPNFRVVPHENAEDYLIKYRGLTLWMKEMDPRRAAELQMLYAQAMQKPYKQDVHELIEALRIHVSMQLKSKSKDEDHEYFFKTEEKATIAGLSYKPIRDRAGGVRQLLRGDNKNSNDSSGTDDEIYSGEEAYTRAISQLIPLVIREQNFISDLFHLSPRAPKSFTDERPLILARVEDRSSLTRKREAVRDVKLRGRLLVLMETTFDTLPRELQAFVDFGTKTDPTQAIGMLEVTEFYLQDLRGSDQTFLLSTVLGLLQKKLMMIFEKFMEEQLKAIEDTKITSKKRKGILTFIRVFPHFAFRMENALNIRTPTPAETRLLVDKAYERLVKVMTETIQSIARLSDETGDDKEALNVQIMMIENMHHFYSEVRALKISVLETWIKWAKAQYDSALSSYIKVVIRRPLGRMLEFFEGVEVEMKRTTPEEVSFHAQYNKATLRKVVSGLTSKDLKKPLDTLYKRVDKHFTEEEGLLQVVWRGIQEEMIVQHERFETLISRCYPDAGVRLEFTINDLLAMFSELAKKVHT